MLIKQIVDENLAPTWDKFVAENSSPSSFLQSWQWSKFRKECLGEDVLRYAIFDSDTQINTNENTNPHKLLAVALFIKRALPGGKFYLNCQRGPVFKRQETRDKRQEIIELLINEIKKIAKQEKIVFVRTAPPYEDNNGLRIRDYGLQRPKILVNLIEPVSTLLLDLTKGEEELLAEMHQKTRYNIKLAEKKGVGVRISNLEFRISDIDTFFELMKQTAKRDKINIFSKSYYKNLLEFFCCHPRESGDLKDDSEDSRLRGNDKVEGVLFTAEFEGKILSAIFVVGFGDSATYLYGASGDEGREMMPNYLLQWSAIKWAKECGYKFYDFWGIAPNFQKNSKFQIPNFKHDWQGITRFKFGFVSEKTARKIKYFGVYDLVFDKIWYNLYRIGKIFKR